jgi:hypothetical protein
MEAMDERRLRLYDLLKPALGERGASELVLALPAEPEQLASKADVNRVGTALEAKIDASFASFEAGQDAKFASFEAGQDARFASFEARQDVRFASFEATMTRRMFAAVFTAVGLWTAILGLGIGVGARLVAP